MRYVVIVAKAPINVPFDTSKALNGAMGERTLNSSFKILILFPLTGTLVDTDKGSSFSAEADKVFSTFD